MPKSNGATRASVFIRADLYIQAKREAKRQKLSTSKFLALAIERAVVKLKLKKPRG